MIIVAIIKKTQNELLAGKCLRDNNCEPTQYCDHDFPNPIGDCVEGLKENESCLRDRKCASKQCSYFKCKKRIQVKDGPCKLDADCPNDQFCDKMPDRDDLKKCIDRKCIGLCKHNHQCSSNKCHLFTCVKHNEKC